MRGSAPVSIPGEPALAAAPLGSVYTGSAGSDSSNFATAWYPGNDSRLEKQREAERRARQSYNDLLENTHKLARMTLQLHSNLATEPRQVAMEELDARVRKIEKTAHSITEQLSAAR